MLLRIQNLLLVVSAALIAVFPYRWLLWIDNDGYEKTADYDVWASSVYHLSLIAISVSLIMYRRRGLQLVINRINIILHLILSGYFVYRLLNLSGDNELSEKGIGMLIPVFSIVLLLLANLVIKRDEALVKSSNRLR